MESFKFAKYGWIINEICFYFIINIAYSYLILLISVRMVGKTVRIASKN
ncbi:hypothetical protein CULT_1690003 [[Clostridium] ultunense Esp]|nr:hypothetical protein CULT_1690003 [[Clostridium] ultunense Esp]